MKHFSKIFLKYSSQPHGSEFDVRGERKETKMSFLNDIKEDAMNNSNPFLNYSDSVPFNANLSNKTNLVIIKYKFKL